MKSLDIAIEALKDIIRCTEATGDFSQEIRATAKDALIDIRRAQYLDDEEPIAPDASIKGID